MWICREDFGIERNQSPEKLSTVTHNSVFAAHRLEMPVPKAFGAGIFLFCKNKPRITRMKRMEALERHRCHVERSRDISRYF